VFLSLYYYFVALVVDSVEFMNCRTSSVFTRCLVSYDIPGSFSDKIAFFIEF